MKKQDNSDNYLEYIPVHKDAVRFDINDVGEVTIFQDNKGIFNRIAQVLWKKPAVSQIHLDEMGNFIWPLIDGTSTVYDISQSVHEQFGEKAEPLYNRLVQYIKTLESYGFITVTKP